MKTAIFFEKVAELSSKFDSIFKSDDDIYVGNGYHTFFYYIKKKLFPGLYNSIDFDLCDTVHFEWQVKNHIMIQDRHIEVDRLGIKANQGTNSEMVFRC